MSLVVIIHSADIGVICSDGRISEPVPNGSRLVKREDSPKFSEISPGLVIAATGRLDLCEDVVELSRQIAQTELEPSNRFSVVADRLAAIGEHAVNMYPERGPRVRVSAALLGYDPRADRMRCITISSADSFRSFEGEQQWNLHVLGDEGAISEALQVASDAFCSLSEFTTLHLTRALCSVIAHVARNHVGINDICFTKVLTRPPPHA